MRRRRRVPSVRVGGDLIAYPAAAEEEPVAVLLQMALRLCEGDADASRRDRLIETVDGLVQANEGLLARQLLVALIVHGFPQPPS